MKKVSSKKKASLKSPQRAVSSESVGDDVIVRDDLSGEDLFVHSSTDIILKLVRSLTIKYDTPYVTSYILSLLMESLVPAAPSFAKEQAQNQLATMMSGLAGQREAVELIRFVQSAGRITNESVVVAGVKELERLMIQREVTFASSKWNPSAPLDVDEPAGPLPPVSSVDTPAPRVQADGVARVVNVPGTMDTRAVPSASYNMELRARLQERESQLEVQTQRVAELEATLARHRPVFDVVEVKKEADEKPEAVLKVAAKKGVAVKRGKGSITFVDNNAPPAAPVEAKVVRYEADKMEVIATARALAAEGRATKRQQMAEVNALYGAASSGTVPMKSSAQTLEAQRSYHKDPRATDLSSTLHPMHYLSSPNAQRQTQFVGTDGSSLCHEQEVTSRNAQQADMYSHLASPPPLMGGRPLQWSSGASSHHAANTTNFNFSDVPSFVAATRRGVQLDAIPPSSHSISSEDVIHLLTDKRPRSAQPSNQHAALYSKQQEQSKRELLDVGEYSLVAAINGNAALQSRLDGVSHALSLERRYTRQSEALAAQSNITMASQLFSHGGVSERTFGGGGGGNNSRGGYSATLGSTGSWLQL